MGLAGPTNAKLCRIAFLAASRSFGIQTRHFSNRPIYHMRPNGRRVGADGAVATVGVARRNHSGPDAPPNRRPHLNGDPRVVLVNTLFWKILVTRVNRKIFESNTTVRIVRPSEPRFVFSTWADSPQTTADRRNSPAAPAVAGARAARAAGAVLLLGACLSSRPGAATPMRRPAPMRRRFPAPAPPR